MKFLEVTSVVDPYHIDVDDVDLDADPDSTYHPDVDPDPDPSFKKSLKHLKKC
jgi:hypothetical protein